MILQQIETSLDPLQFAYRENIGMEDATLYLLNLIYKHLEKTKACARLLFIDFSSAFNTIQPYLLIEKLKNKNVAGWILDFLTGRSQCFKINDVYSKQLFCPGSSQGCCLSPYILHTQMIVTVHMRTGILLNMQMILS